MLIRKNKIVSLVNLLLILMFLIVVLIPQAEAASAADFYKDKKMVFIVNQRAGGGTDLIVRFIAPYLKKYTEAYSVVVENVPEGGGMLGINRLWNSKPDGLTIAIGTLDTTVMMEVDKEPGVQYQSDKLTVLFAASSNIGEALLVSAKGPFNSVEELRKTKGLKSAASFGGAVSTAFFADVLGLDAKISTGITYADANMAMLRGETQFGSNSLVSVLRDVANGDMRPLCVNVSGGIPQLPQAPPINKFASLSSQQKEWQKLFEVTDSGKYIFAAPNVPQERIEYLQAVFAKIHQDPQFLQDRKKFETYPGTLPWLNSADAQKVAKNFINLARGEGHRQMVEYLGKKYFTVK